MKLLPMDVKKYLKAQHAALRGNHAFGIVLLLLLILALIIASTRLGEFFDALSQCADNPTEQTCAIGPGSAGSSDPSGWILMR